MPAPSSAPSAAPTAAVTHVVAPAPSTSAVVVVPEPLQLSFEMERETTSSGLWLVVPGRPKTKLRDVPEPFTCAMTEETQRPHDGCSWSIGCKPGDLPICVRRQRGEVSLLVPGQQPQNRELARVAIASAQALEVDTRIRGSSDEADCPADAPPVVVDARLLLRTLPGSKRASWFEVPSLGVGLEALYLHTPTACDSERVRNALKFYCMTVESSSTFRASVKGGVLSMRVSSTSYDGDSERALGAVKLPCGAQLKWQRLRLRDRAWSGVAFGQCGQACNERHADCEDRCRTQHPADYHDDGNPALDQGEDCLAECPPCPITAARRSRRRRRCSYIRIGNRSVSNQRPW